MNILLVQLAIVFLPGLIWAQLDVRYAQKAKPSQAEFLIRAFIFGLMTYAAVYIVYACLGKEFSTLWISQADPKTLSIGDFVDEVLWSLPVSFFLAIIWIAGSTYKWLTRFLQFIRVTQKYGDEDVWDFTFNSSRAEVEYVHLRDFEKNITYAGWVDSFSETGKLRELLLREVCIYDSEGNEIEVPLLYLARKVDDIHIEFPYRGVEQEQHDAQRST